VYDSVLKAGGNTSDEVYGSDGSLSAKITCEAEKEGELREALNDATRGEVSFLKGMDA
jgi:ribosome maturation protein Sdo1